MLIIKRKDSYKIVSDSDLKFYKTSEIIGHLEGNYPSLKSLEISKKNTKEFIDYLNQKIKEHNKQIKTYKIQLKKFRKDLVLLGVKE